MFEYDGRLARWWHARCSDRAHDYAYGNIAGYIHSSFESGPRLIVDYACGAGNLLRRLAALFPESRLVGVDGSRYLLDLASRRFQNLGRRIALTRACLPGLDLPALRADLVAFCFPNMVPPPGDAFLRRARRYLTQGEVLLGRELARGRRDELSLLMGRVVSLDLRGLLRRGGMCVRVEYAKARRHELRRDDLLRVSFEEGSLDMEVNGKRARQWFRVSASAYFRSRVMEDVYQQTGDTDDRGGGYVITILQAV